MNNRQAVEEKVDEYRAFLDSTLRPQLALAKTDRRVVLDEIDEYQDLMDRLGKLKELSTMTVDLGWNKAYCEATVVVPQQSTTPTQKDAAEDPNVFVNVGMGFHVELTITEAIQFCLKRMDFLKKKLANRTSKLQKMEEHVSTAEDILDHLSNEALSMPR